MAKLSFKSVGETLNSDKFLSSKTFDLPYGITTPLQVGDDSLFEMSSGMASQIYDNLKNLIMTNHGERLGQFSFGANLQPLLSERISNDSFDAEAMRRIKTAVNFFMPYISLKDFETQIGEFDEITRSTSIFITLTYDIKDLGVVNKKIVVSLLPIC